MAAAIPSWHIDIKTWNQRNEFLFKNEIMSDCKFIVTDGGNKTIIPAHKYVLGGNSEEFYNLFYLMESSDEIPIENTSAVNFTKFLEFLYTEKTGLTMENVEDLLKLAKRYSVSHFEEFCCEFLTENVKQETALSVMDKYSDYQMPNLMDKCASLISKNQLIFESPAFLRISIQTLTDLLKSEKFYGKEFTIFNGVNKWAENFCQERNLEVNSENKRSAVKPALEHIRFASMTLNEFAICTINPSVLTPAEIVQIMQFFATNGEVECSFSAKQRLNEEPNSGIKRFNLILDDSKFVKGMYDLNRNFNILTFSVNRYILLHGIGIYGSTSTDTEVIPEKFCIKLKDENGKGIIESSMNVLFDGTTKTYQICFGKSMLLQPGRIYNVAVHRHSYPSMYLNMFEYYGSMNVNSILNGEMDRVQFNINYVHNICKTIIFNAYKNL